MSKTFIEQRVHDVLHGLTALPKRKDFLFAATLFVIYSIIVLLIGFSTEVFTFSLLIPEKAIHYLLPITLIFFPCIPEELFFRGAMLPRKKLNLTISKQLIYSLGSSVLFVLWHPVNAYLINYSAIPLFTNIYFLVIVFLLGMVCAITYLQSGSLWIPILIHWLTVSSWVFFLGGRNKVLEVFQR